MARFDIAFYMKLKRMDYDDIKKLNYDEILTMSKKATEMASNRQKTMLEYMKTYDIESTPAMQKPYRERGEHKQSSSKFGKEEKFEGFQTYNFELDKNKISNINYLRYKLNMAKRYLGTKTSTITGWKKMMDDFSTRLEKKFDIKIDRNFLGRKDKYEMLWRIYRDIRAQQTEEVTGLTSGEIQKLIVETMEQHKEISDIEDLRDIIIRRTNKNYEEKLEEKYDEDFFDKQLKTGTERKKKKNGYRTNKL